MVNLITMARAALTLLLVASSVHIGVLTCASTVPHLRRWYVVVIAFFSRATLVVVGIPHATPAVVRRGVAIVAVVRSSTLSGIGPMSATLIVRIGVALIRSAGRRLAAPVLTILFLVVWGRIRSGTPPDVSLKAVRTLVEVMISRRTHWTVAATATATATVGLCPAVTGGQVGVTVT